jgi:tRNA/tmRNA/rRNA uracil-C5-methylase (TrmA/RlmC/RlmD family)
MTAEAPGRADTPDPDPAGRSEPAGTSDPAVAPDPADGTDRAGPPDQADRTDRAGPPDPAGRADRAPSAGELVTLDIGPVAHGGHCVARWDGRVVFVRHALPGERAVVRITDTSHAGYFRGDAIDILTADPRRVTPPCSHFVPGGCGGCDFQHADRDLQLELKAAVVTEQLSRLAGIERTVTVQPLPGNGFRWRTRVRWALDEAGRIGPRAARSHQVVAVSGAEPCEIAADGLSELVPLIDVPPGVRGTAGARPTPRGSGRGGKGNGRDRQQRRAGRRPLPEVTLLRTPDGERMAVWHSTTAPTVTETVAGRRFSVAATGFWQVHPAAASALSAAVDEALDGIDLLGGTGWDLYGGVGLFGVLLATRVGSAGRVLTVENDPLATELAAANLNDLPQARAITGTVEQLLLSEPAGQLDAVVLDPPRSGAGRAVCMALAGRRPRVIVYVACDPAALARDTAFLAEHGYRLDTLRAFDCFPQTHHVECVARFLPAD